MKEGSYIVRVTFAINGPNVVWTATTPDYDTMEGSSSGVAIGLLFCSVSKAQQLYPQEWQNLGVGRLGNSILANSTNIGVEILFPGE